MGKPHPICGLVSLRIVIEILVNVFAILQRFNNVISLPQGKALFSLLIIKSPKIKYFLINDLLAAAEDLC